MGIWAANIGLMEKQNKKIAEDVLTIGGEIILDTQIVPGILREIPLVKSVLTFVQAGKTVSEFLYLRKLKIFIEDVEEVSEGEFQKFIADADATPDKIAERLLTILDRIDDEMKAHLVSGTFKAYINREFGFEVFKRILAIIDRGFLDDLIEIKIFGNHDQLLTNGVYVEASSLDELFSCGLLVNLGIDGGSVEDDGGTIYALNSYGKIFLRVVNNSQL